MNDQIADVAERSDVPKVTCPNVANAQDQRAANHKNVEETPDSILAVDLRARCAHTAGERYHHYRGNLGVAAGQSACNWRLRPVARPAG